LAALALTFIGTGWVLSFAVLPARLGPYRRFFLSAALSVPATIAAAVPGLLSRHLTPLSFGGGLALMAAVAAFRSRRLLQHPWQRLSRLGERLRVRSLLSRLPGLLGVAAAVAAGAIVVFAPQVRARGGRLVPIAGASWRYWALVRQVATAGRVPSTDLEWGAHRTFPIEYLAASIHGAVTAELGGGATLRLLDYYGLAMVVLALLVFGAFWGRWLPPWWAAVAAVLTMSAARLSFKFASYRPETFGLTLVIWSAWLLDEALQRRSPRWAALAGVVSATALVAHAEVWLTTVGVWLGVVGSRLLGRAIVSMRRQEDTETKRVTPRRWLAVSSTTVLAFVATVFVFFSLTGSGNRLAHIVGLRGRTVEAGHLSIARKWGPDPTWSLRQATEAPNRVHLPPPDVYRHIFSVTDTVAPWTNVSLKEPRLFTVLAVAITGLSAVTSLVMSLRGRRPLFGGPGDPKRLGSLGRGFAVSLGIATGLVLVVAAIRLAYHTYVPDYSGPYRLFPYWVLALAGALACLGYLASRALYGGLVTVVRATDRRSVLRAGCSLIVNAAVSVVILLAVVTPKVVVPRWNGVMAPSAYKALSWVRAHTPPKSIVLANSFTQGSIAFVARRDGWLDGRLPYLEADSWVEEAISRMVNAGRFFANPLANSGSLPRQVDVVVAVKPPLNVGGVATYPVNLKALKLCPRLQLLKSFGNDRVLVFYVRHSASTA
jgi:hypothetical protein